jgi:hypothetical protein
MGALAIIPSSSLPPARRALVDLNRRIVDAESQLATLVNGRDRLRSELGRADTARHELDALISGDAVSLAGKLRSGASWALSHFGSARALNLVASLSESGLQRQVGEKALAEIEAEIAVFKRELSDMRARKPDAVRAVLIEASAGFREDLANAIDDLRQSLTILAALDRVTARGDGSFRPNERIAVEIPSLGTMPAQPVIAPNSAIQRAQSILIDFADELESNPLADVETLKFPHVIGNEDAGKTSYADLSRAERQIIDFERASGVN